MSALCGYAGARLLHSFLATGQETRPTKVTAAQTDTHRLPQT